VLALLLHEFPKQLTRDDLKQAIRSLDLVGLLWCEGEVVLPTLPARHLD
jgi:hypothetical protein